MNEKHRQIHEENIRNRHKCYGYSQPEILYGLITYVCFLYVYFPPFQSNYIYII